MADQEELDLIDEYRKLFGGRLPLEGPAADVPGPVGPPAISEEDIPRPSPLQEPDRLRQILKGLPGAEGGFQPNAMPAGPQGRPPISSYAQAALAAYGGSRGQEAAAAQPPAQASPPPAAEPPAAEPPVLGSEDFARAGGLYNPEEKYNAAEHTPEAEDKARKKKLKNLAGQDKAKEEQMLKDAERERRRLQGWRDIAQGLGGLGQSLAALPGHLPPEAFAGPDTGAIDRELVRLEDKLTPEEEDMLRQAFGANAIPRGLRRSTVKSILPAVAGYMASKTNRETQAARDVHKETLALEKEERGRKERETKQADIDKRDLRAKRLQALGRFENYPPLTRSQEQKQAAQAALRALDTGEELNNGLAQLSATVTAARAAGDNRLSNEDIQRWLTRWGYQGWIDKFTRLTKAELPAEHVEQLRQILKTYIRNADDVRRIRARVYSHQVAGELQMDPDELEDLYRGSDVTPSEGGEERVRYEHNGSFYNVPKARIPAFLKSHLGAAEAPNG